MQANRQITKFFLCLSCLIMSNWAHAAYKCTDEDGGVVFSQTPCPFNEGEKLEIKPSSGKGNQYAPDMNKRLKSFKYQQQRDQYKSRNYNYQQKQKKKYSGNSANKARCQSAKNNLSRVKSQIRQGYSGSQATSLIKKERYYRGQIRSYCD